MPHLLKMLHRKTTAKELAHGIKQNIQELAEKFFYELSVLLINKTTVIHAVFSSPKSTCISRDGIRSESFIGGKSRKLKQQELYLWE